MVTRMNFQRTFGRYLLLRRIAMGGMAEVFRAMSCGTEGFRKLVAIKRMLPHLSADNDFINMFIDEAKLVANLNYSNIVQIHDFGRIDDLLFHAMEYVHGKNLAEIIEALQARGRPTPIDMACTIFSQVLYGLDQAHKHRDRFGQALNIIHRDMSPQNILVSYSGEVKIADFGIAKATQTSVQTQVGFVKGKFRYMSPEQAWGRPLDQRTDQFSVATCFCELLTQRDMFYDLNEKEVLRRVRHVEFTRPREVNPDIPKKLESIVLKALEQDPDKRYPDAGAFGDALDAYATRKDLRLASSSQLGEAMRALFEETIREEQKRIAEESRLAEAVELEGAGREEPFPSIDDEALEKPTRDEIPMARSVEMRVPSQWDRAAPAGERNDEEDEDEAETTEMPRPPGLVSEDLIDTGEESPVPAEPASARRKPLTDRTTMRDMQAYKGDNPTPAEPSVPLGERPTLEVPSVRAQEAGSAPGIQDRPTLEDLPHLRPDGSPASGQEEPEDQQEEDEPDPEEP